jgi:hypothetical protein
MVGLDDHGKAIAKLELHRSLCRLRRRGGCDPDQQQERKDRTNELQGPFHRIV